MLDSYWLSIGFMIGIAVGPLIAYAIISIFRLW